MLVEKLAEKHLEILKERSEIKWVGSKYIAVKESSTTAKGVFGQNYTNDLLNEMGIKSEIINGGIGDFDLEIEKSVKIEHKLATEDTHESFQFNGFMKRADFDFAFCLGVSPNELYFKVITKDRVNKLTTHMYKKGGDGFKYTEKKKNMFQLTEENILKEFRRLGIV